VKTRGFSRGTTRRGEKKKRQKRSTPLKSAENPQKKLCVEKRGPCFSPPGERETLEKNPKRGFETQSRDPKGRVKTPNPKREGKDF